MERNILEIVFFCLLCCAVVTTSKPPKGFEESKKNYDDVWRRNSKEEIQHRNTIIEHQTKSDAMELYSIQARRIVRITESDESVPWEPKFKLSVKSKKKRNRKNNKFVTETVSYQRLKIRSAENNKYLCAKTNGEIVFREFADKEDKVADGSRAFFLLKGDKNNKPRKRCLFHWEFTKQMHIKLSLEAANKTRYYLSVKDDVISLRKEKDCSELERSFIWLPTKPAKGPLRKSQFMKARMFGFGKKEKTGGDKQKQRAKVERYCSYKDLEQTERIKFLEKQVMELSEKLDKVAKLEEEVSDTLDTY